MENDQVPAEPKAGNRPPWNKGKLVGAKPPLRPNHVWSIRTKLQMTDRKRDLALFNLAIDSKLRGCDVVALRVDDVAPSGYAMDRATIKQKKTGRPVRFELTDHTRLAIDEYLRLTVRKPGQNALTETHEGGAYLPAHRQSARCSALARAFEDREHGSLSRHRSRRRDRDRGKDRNLTQYPRKQT